MNVSQLIKALQEVPNPMATDVTVAVGFDGVVESVDSSGVLSGGIELADAGVAEVIGEDAV